MQKNVQKQELQLTSLFGIEEMTETPEPPTVVIGWLEKGAELVHEVVSHVPAAVDTVKTLIQQQCLQNTTLLQFLIFF